MLCIGKIQVIKKRNQSQKLTLVCSFRSCLMSARFSLSFALSSRKRLTTSEVWPIQDLIALSLLRWASINCQKGKRLSSLESNCWYQELVPNTGTLQTFWLLHPQIHRVACRFVQHPLCLRRRLWARWCSGRGLCGHLWCASPSTPPERHTGMHK